jgi:hypothetical protein
LAEEAAAGDFLIIYDTSTGTLKKIQRSNITLQIPIVTSISPTNVDSKDSATTTTFTVTGTGFSVGITAVLISNGGTEISFNTITRDSATQLTCVLNNALVTAVTDEPYDIKVTNSSNLTSTLTNQINVDQRPVFVTAAGTLGTQRSGSFSATIEATDPESAGAVRYDVVGGTLPTGITLDSSTGVVSGSITPESSDTTYNFTIQASDVDSNVSFRDFSITLSGPSVTSFTSSGTFAVPSGITSVDVLVVAGGGGGGGRLGGAGGAGGLIFRPAFTVTPGGTVSVTVGDGGAFGNFGPGTPGEGITGQDSVFGTLTAKGGGGGIGGSGSSAPGKSGGSGGGGRLSGNNGGTATQPTQPGDSGTYGFGNTGGAGYTGSPGVDIYRTGGGGGAGASGVNGQQGGTGGVGRAYTIADGTTPVFYAGGGGGGGEEVCGIPSVPVAAGGQGGGGASAGYNPNIASQPGTANRGGGGGGGSTSASPGDTPINGGLGGKGIVIVRY